MRREMKRTLLIGLGLVVLVGVSGCASSTPTERAAFDPSTKEFAPCPDSPNCVQTEAPDERHAIEPYAFTGDAADAKASILAIVDEMPRNKVVTDGDNYLHVEFRSRIFRFVDDVEFFFDEADSVVRFRSASRTGYSDMGVNRKRMETIRQAFAVQQP